jgi:hypothetical protein
MRDDRWWWWRMTERVRWVFEALKVVFVVVVVVVATDREI